MMMIIMIITTIIMMITRFQSGDQVCILTTIIQIDRSALSQTCHRNMSQKYSGKKGKNVSISAKQCCRPLDMLTSLP